MTERHKRRRALPPAPPALPPLTDHRLTTHDDGPELGLSADTLHLRGEVTLYLTRFSGCLAGLVCLTFTPDTLPVPPVVPPFVFMTDVDAEQALVTSNLITADGLRLRAGARSGPGARGGGPRGVYGTARYEHHRPYEGRAVTKR
ncbi:hypothetical protein [Streptomyces lydicus]|uniref:hypothetical protein n=1 Tax=Streptomyces lydicus TaxID=47763 RepID=UPI0037A59BD3